MGASPASLRAFDMRSAVRAAVPDGASTLLGWCSSIISADSKYFAAFVANSIIKTAPMAKLGAIRTPDLDEAKRLLIFAIRASSNPVVPMTAFMFFEIKNSRLAMTESGVVKSTTTCAPFETRASSESPRSSAATSSRSEASLTALTTSEPMRPRAPSTPTLIIFEAPSQI